MDAQQTKRSSLVTDLQINPRICQHAFKFLPDTVSDKNRWDTLTKRCFFPSRAPLVPLKVVYRGLVTKSCTPTLRGQGDPKVSQPFWLRLCFRGILGMWLLVGSSGGKSLGRYMHVSEPFFREKTLEISRIEREKTINRGKKSLFL